MIEFTRTGAFSAEATLPTTCVVDWRKSFEVDDSGLVNHPRRNDTGLPCGPRRLLRIEAGKEQPAVGSLSVRKLLGGRLAGQSSGQARARTIDTRALRPAELRRRESDVVARLCSTRTARRGSTYVGSAARGRSHASPCGRQPTGRQGVRQHARNVRRPFDESLSTSGAHS